MNRSRPAILASNAARIAAFFLLALPACGTEADARSPAGAPTQEDDSGAPSRAAPVAPEEDVASPNGSTAGAGACPDGALVRSVSLCIDQANKSPRQCFAERAAGHSPCDLDKDGLDDNLEDALAASYALAFAFHEGSNPEKCWPGNVEFFVKSSLLLYSPGGASSLFPASVSGYKVLDEAPTLGGIEAAQYTFKGTTYHASSPHQDHGPNYWLCQKKAFDPSKYGGPLGPAEKLATLELASHVPGGIQAYSIVHPTLFGQPSSADGEAGSRYVFIATELFYPYNEFPLDNHEGDWEGGGVIVDTEDMRGSVLGAYFDRHPSSDTIQLTMLGGDTAPVDPAQDTPVANQCGDAGKGVLGLRFWDIRSARHHVVIYPASGGHAGYGYPGTTKILGPACTASLEASDPHDGDGAKFLPWAGTFEQGFTESSAPMASVAAQIVNLGEESAPREAWAGYRGQWGCQDGVEGRVAASWPGPFGNHRHCRAWLRHDWNVAPPFSPPNPAIDCQGL